MAAASSLVVLAAVLLGADAPDDVAHSGNAPRQIAAKAIPYVLDAGERWQRQKDCLSCHRVAMTSWALNAAAREGIAFDPDRGDALRDWTADWRSVVNPKRRDDTSRKDALRGEPDTIAQLLLASAVEKGRSVVDDDYADQLLAARLDDGTWPATGQLPLQDRPEPETHAVTTGWVLVALHDAGRADTAELRTVLATLPDPSDAATSETAAVRLLLDALGGDESATAERDRLLRLQNDDGGWPWRIGGESDALGTGIALYALARSETTTDDPAVADAVAWLAETQQASGRWSVPGTKRTAGGRITETASYWGTCWAVIGLLEFAD